MKKLIGALVLFSLLFSLVVIAEEETKDERGIKIVDENKLTGIENAITRGNKTNETIQHLQEVLAKIEDKRLEQISKLENLKINETKDGKVKIEGEIVGKMFGLFKDKHTDRFEVSEDGTVKELGWFKWLWKDN